MLLDFLIAHIDFWVIYNDIIRYELIISSLSTQIVSFQAQVPYRLYGTTWRREVSTGNIASPR